MAIDAVIKSLTDSALINASADGNARAFAGRAVGRPSQHIWSSQSIKQSLTRLGYFPWFSPQKNQALVAKTAGSWKRSSRPVGQGLGTGILGVAGAAGGAAVGTVICPVVGTIAGAVIGGLVGGCVGYKLGGWAGDQAADPMERLGEFAGKRQVRRREAHEQSAAVQSTERLLQGKRIGDSALRAARPSKDRLVQLYGTYHTFRKRLHAKFGVEPPKDSRRVLKASMTSEATKAMEVLDCRRLAWKGQILDLVLQYEWRASEACNRVLDGLIGDGSGRHVAMSEARLAKRFADAQTAVWLAYQAERAHWDVRRGDASRTVPPRLASPEDYFRDVMGRAASQRGLSGAAGAQRAWSLIMKPSAFQRLYLATHVLSNASASRKNKSDDVGTDVLRGCMRDTLLAFSGYDSGLAFGLKRYDWQAEAVMQAAVEERNPPQIVTAIKAAANVLPRLMAVRDVLSSRGRAVVPVVGQRLTGKLPTVPENRPL